LAIGALVTASAAINIVTMSNEVSRVVRIASTTMHK